MIEESKYNQNTSNTYNICPICRSNIKDSYCIVCGWQDNNTEYTKVAVGFAA